MLLIVHVPRCYKFVKLFKNYTYWHSVLYYTVRINRRSCLYIDCNSVYHNIILCSASSSWVILKNILFRLRKSEWRVKKKYAVLFISNSSHSSDLRNTNTTSTAPRPLCLQTISIPPSKPCKHPFVRELDSNKLPGNPLLTSTL